MKNLNISRFNTTFFKNDFKKNAFKVASIRVCLLHHSSFQDKILCFVSPPSPLLLYAQKNAI